MSDFHFLRPDFLLLIPLILLIALMIPRLGTSSSWSRYIAASKLKLLIRNNSARGGKNPLLFSLAGVICCLALAGPSWEMRPVPTSENISPLVILFDLSPSMLAQDIQPDRLVRARLKIADLLRLRKDGQTALVAYSGSAHRVSPLTDDSSTIEALLSALHPGVMPQTGSNIEAAVELGLELLTSSGYADYGHLLVVTDGIEPEAQKALNNMLPAGVKLSILGVGSVEGAPIPLGGGNFFRDSRGDIVLARLNRNELQVLAGRSGGRYIELQADDSDLNYLLAHIEEPRAAEDAEIASSFDTWHDAGYWLIILLIPLALLAFRRDFLFCLPLVMVLSWPAPKAEAGIWQDLWLTKDQQALKALQEGQASEAAELFESGEWKGYAAYQAEDFETALHQLQELEDTSLYNLGTSQARAGQLEEALENLNRFVEQNPQHENARINRDLVEQLLEQQQEQEQQQQDQQQNGGQDQQSQDSEQNSREDGEEPQQQDSAAGDQQQDQEQSGESEPSEADQQESEQDAGQSADEESQQESEQQAQMPQGSEEETEQQAQSETAQMSEVQPEDLSDASEQWLRAIPDDPSGLLRRKFEYESQLYQQQQRFLPPTSANEEQRY